MYLTTNNIDAEGDDPAAIAAVEGTDLVLRNIISGSEETFRYVSDYFFNKTGRKLLIRTTRNSKDSLSKSFVLLVDLKRGITDTLSRGGNDFKNFSMTDDGLKVAYLAERDSSSKALQKFYKVWYYKTGMDSSMMLVDKNSVGMKLGQTVSEYGTISFSKSGKRVFFGTAPIQPPRDTSLVDIDLVKLDIWHYHDDYLQTRQLFNLQNDLRQNYLAVYDLDNNSMKQLGSKEIPQVIQTKEGDGDIFIGITDEGKRIESQWTGNTLKDIYAIHVNDGTKKRVKNDLNGDVYASSTGKYILWYDNKARNYFAFDGDSTRNITRQIKLPLYDEENDIPDDPGPYGIMGWNEGDSSIYIYDRYDVWRVDPAGVSDPVNITGDGRKSFNRYRYVNLDPDEKYLRHEQSLFFRTQNQKNKTTGIAVGRFSKQINFYWIESNNPYNYSILGKSKNSDDFTYFQRELYAIP